MLTQASASTRNVAAFALAIAVTYTVAVARIIPPLTVSLLATVLLLYLATAALNLVWGYSGQLNLALAAVEALAAYSTILLLQSGAPFLLALAAGVLVGGASAVGVALLLRRLSGLYYAIATFGIGLLLMQVITTLEFTGGAEGLVHYDPYLGLPATLVADSLRFDALVIAACAVAVAAAVSNLVRTVRGRALLAIRENASHAASVGVEVSAARLLAAALAGAIAGLAGALYIMHVKAVDPTSMSIHVLGFSTVLAVLVGGRGTFWGPIIGSVIVGSAAVLSPLRDSWTYIALGVLTIAVARGFPRGIAGTIAERRSHRRRRAGGGVAENTMSVHALEPDAPRRGLAPIVQHRSLSAVGLAKSFGSVRALDDVSLDISLEPAEIVGMAGPNGAGKSTLMAVLSGALHADAGQVMLDGVDVPPGEAARVRAGIARMAQDSTLFSELTCRDNLLVALAIRSRPSVLQCLVYLPGVATQERELSSAADGLLAQFGLEQFAEHRVDELSYGNRRLLAMAAAVATRPAVLLLDEPTAGLSPASLEGIRGQIMKVAAAGAGVLLIDHRLDFLDAVTKKIVMMAEGRLLQTASLAEHMAHEDVAAAYLGAVSADGAATARAEVSPSADRPTRAGLGIESVSVGYDGREVLRDITLDIPSGTIVGWLGPNGAGKTTLGRAVVGAIPTQSGTVRLGDEVLTGRDVASVVRQGVVFVSSGRRVFPRMSVRENIELAARAARSGRVPVADVARQVEAALEVFPDLRPLQERPASQLSGGQQQMVVTARGLVADPDVLILDEPFAGLSPRVCDELQDALSLTAATFGTTVVVIDQDVSRVSGFATHLCLLASGELQVFGQTRDVVARADLFRRFLGVGEVGVDGLESTPSLLRGGQ